MRRGFTVRCSECGAKYWQDWEEPDECPCCGGEGFDDEENDEEGR